LNNSVAHVCRKVCHVAHSTPALLDTVNP
jgi:hypothetical protein